MTKVFVFCVAMISLGRVAIAEHARGDTEPWDNRMQQLYEDITALKTNESSAQTKTLIRAARRAGVSDDEVRAHARSFARRAPAGVPKKEETVPDCTVSVSSPAQGAKVERKFDVEIAFTGGKKPNGCTAVLVDQKSTKIVGYCPERSLWDSGSLINCGNVVAGDKVTVDVTCKTDGSKCTTSIQVEGP